MANRKVSNKEIKVGTILERPSLIRTMDKTVISGDLILHHYVDSNNDNNLVYRVVNVREKLILVKLLYNLQLDWSSASFFLKRKPLALEPNDLAYKQVFKNEEPFGDLFRRIFRHELKQASDLS